MAVAAFLVAIVLLSLLLIRHHWRMLLLGFAALGLVAGLMRYEAHESAREAEGLARFIGQEEVDIQGRIDSYPEERGQVTQFRVQAEKVFVDGGWRATSGRILVTARPTRTLIDRRDPPYFHTGDRLWLKGALETPKPLGEFDFPAYLAQQGVRSVMSFPRLPLVEEDTGPWFDRALFSIRSRLAQSLEESLPEPQSGLAKAIILGIRSGLPESLEDDFNRSGTTHLLAISGQNVSILLAAVLLFGLTLFRRSRTSVSIAALLLIWGYALLAGLPPSAFRAAVMGSVYIVALLLGRQRHGLEALMLSGVVITLFAPAALWQVSFHLSFLAMAGIVLLMPAAHDYLVPELDTPRRTLLAQILRWAVVVAIMSVVATLFTWPAIAFYFHRVSLATIPATILASPAMPVAMVAAALTAFAGLFWPGGAWLFGWLAWVGLSYLAAVASLFASLPLSVVTIGGISRAFIVLYYLGLAVLAWVLRSMKSAGMSLGLLPPKLPRLEGTRLSRYGIAMLALVLAAGSLWTGALWPSSTRLEVTSANRGDGAAILVQTPSRHTVLIDTSADGLTATQLLGERLSYQGKRIDAAIATSPRVASIGGMAEVARRYQVKTSLSPAAQRDAAAYAGLNESLRERGTERRTVQVGQLLRMGKATIDVLHAPADSSATEDDSLVLRIGYGRAMILLAHGASGGTLARLPDGAVAGASLVLLANGKPTDSHERLLKSAAPQVVVLLSRSVDGDEGNMGATARRLLPQAQLAQIAARARITVETDGRRLWLGR
jgi:competence protein ComEC